MGRHAILPDFFAATHTTPHMTDDAARRNGVIATIPQYILWDGTNVHRLTFMPSRTGVGRHAIIAQKSPPSHTHIIADKPFDDRTVTKQNRTARSSQRHSAGERGERLVEQEHARLDGQRAGQGHALLLAA